MVDVNPVIGSGFDDKRNTFAGDTQSSRYYYEDSGLDHPFHNVDHNTMMVCVINFVFLDFL